MSAYSVFTNRVTKTLAREGEPVGSLGPIWAVPLIPAGQKVVIRKLNGKRLDKASTALQVQAVDMMQQLGGAAATKSLQELMKTAEDSKKEPDAGTPAPEPSEPVKPVKRYHGYDRDTLLAQAVISWDLDEPLSPESIEELDDDLADAFATAVMELTKPKRTETEEKNG